MSKKTLVDFFVQRLQRIVDTPPEDQDWVEGAKFMGMIERIDPNHPILDQASKSLASEKGKAICAFAEINVKDIVDALVGAVASDEQHTFDLFTLDSLCAGAYVLGCTHLLHDELRLVLQDIIHQPQKWEPLRDIAQGVLERGRPLKGDPARAFWFSIDCTPNTPQELT